MAKKKSVRKSTKKKKVVKSKKIDASKKKINLVVRNIVIFVSISLISYVLYKILNKAMFENLFLLLAMIFAFLSVAFLIVLLTFVFLRFLKRK